MFRIAVRPFLDRAGFLAAAGDEGLTLLLGLLAELQSIALHPLGFSLAALLQTKGLNTNLLKFREALLPCCLVLLAELSLELDRFLIKLLAALQPFLFELLTALAELLLQLSQPGLMLLFCLGDLLPGLGDHLLALLAGLVAQFRHLPLGFTADRLAINQLIPLLLGLGNDVVRLLAGLLDELILFGPK